MKVFEQNSALTVGEIVATWDRNLTIFIFVPENRTLYNFHIFRTDPLEHSKKTQNLLLHFMQQPGTVIKKIPKYFYSHTKREIFKKILYSYYKTGL